jgi:hypothetical protein
MASGWIGNRLGQRSSISPETSLAKSVLPPTDTLDLIISNSIIRALVGAMKLGKETIFAQTDGGLQIVIPRKDDEGNETNDKVIYERAYYALAFEVMNHFILYT